MSLNHDLRIEIARAYDAAGAHDGYRALVDRLWPRGVRKDDLVIDEWCGQIAPSAELRGWYGHDAARFDEFRQRYLDELAASDEPRALLERVGRHHRRLTLVTAAKDEAHSNGVVLREYLRSLL